DELHSLRQPRWAGRLADEGGALLHGPAVVGAAMIAHEWSNSSEYSNMSPRYTASKYSTGTPVALRTTRRTRRAGSPAFAPSTCACRASRSVAAMFRVLAPMVTPRRSRR